ncbi:hypothetical protein [Streptomyces sp. RKAG293]|uniref:hypothetical protein n=1 Tax=Streptomyces sp. RKAG293 TaxID=2893403 RepID=UPI0020347B3B|nr:hypothetical protein [Streptomyces sp. RKAG293]MCM2418807.1 hypothetical protein [Streptomyces sp. RKAG293]
MNTASTVYIVLGLFLAGGVYSFWRQKLPTGVIVLLGIGALMAFGAGLMSL